MNEQTAFNFSQVWPVKRAPYHGTSVQTREASRSGSDRVTPTHELKSARLLKLFETDGPLTMNECASKLGLPLSSICSLLDVIREELEEYDTVTIAWPTGKKTSRTRWRIKS